MRSGNLTGKFNKPRSDKLDLGFLVCRKMSQRLVIRTERSIMPPAVNGVISPLPFKRRHLGYILKSIKANGEDWRYPIPVSAFLPLLPKISPVLFCRSDVAILCQFPKIIPLF